VYSVPTAASNARRYSRAITAAEGKPRLLLRMVRMSRQPTMLDSGALSQIAPTSSASEGPLPTGRAPIFRFNPRMLSSLLLRPAEVWRAFYWIEDENELQEVENWCVEGKLMAK
jgi:hypothetical protein